MTIRGQNQKIGFYLPPKGVLEIMGPDDPLPLYYNSFVGFIYRNRIKQALSLLRPPYDSILEVGYGSGILLPTLARIGNSVYGVDIDSDPGKVKSNLERLGINASLAKGDIRKTDYSDGKFNLIIAISVLEHIRDLEPVIKEIFRILTPGGIFLVGMPRVDSFMEKLFPLIGEPNIKSRHVTNHQQVLKAGSDHFELVKIRNMALISALYFNILFRKR